MQSVTGKVVTCALQKCLLQVAKGLLPVVTIWILSIKRSSGHDRHSSKSSLFKENTDREP